MPEKPHRTLVRLLVLALAAAVGDLAVNAASATDRWPGLMNVIRRHPWPALAVVVAAGVAVELLLSRSADRRRGPVPTDPDPHPRPGTPFEVAWSGTDPLDSFADAPPAGFFTVSAIMLAGLAWQVNGSLDRAILDDRANPAGPFLFLAVGCGLLAIVLWISKVVGDRTVSPQLTPWSLRVDADAITIGAQDQEWIIEWTEILQVTEAKVLSLAWRRLRVLHIEFDPVAIRPAEVFAVGWPGPVYPGFYLGLRGALTGRWVPICVYGPMNDRQRKDLRDALARFGGRRATRFWTQERKNAAP
ncbi:hypothetical protein [Hamadaea tsunoensis]|uniref:hypothetical protein n=1 Tax=Hamadaea tsunoensis TaxID=53368 RepID=UPI00040E9A46|nr:hypothetical protein [Hamadaea tsunoensis]